MRKFHRGAPRGATREVHVVVPREHPGNYLYREIREDVQEERVEVGGIMGGERDQGTCKELLITVPICWASTLGSQYFTQNGPCPEVCVQNRPKIDPSSGNLKGILLRSWAKSALLSISAWKCIKSDQISCVEGRVRFDVYHIWIEMGYSQCLLANVVGIPCHHQALCLETTQQMIHLMSKLILDCGGEWYALKTLWSNIRQVNHSGEVDIVLVRSACWFFLGWSVSCFALRS